MNMPDNDQTSVDNVIIHINDSLTYDNGYVFRVRHTNVPNTLAEVEEDGAITFTGAIERAGVQVLDADAAGSSTGGMLTLQKDTDSVLYIDVSSTEGVAIETYGRTDDDLTLKSAGDVKLMLDHDGDAGAQSYFHIKDSGGYTRFTVSFDSTNTGVYLKDTSANETMSIEKTSAVDEVAMAVGCDRSGDSLRGEVKCYRDPTVDSERCGLLIMRDKDGNQLFLFADTSGNLKIKSSDPGTDDSTGIVVGTQS
jgi:hypothetical protein